MRHTHRAIDLLIALAAERIGCAYTCVAPTDDTTSRTVHVTTMTGNDVQTQIPASAELLTITKLLLAAYESEVGT